MFWAKPSGSQGRTFYKRRIKTWQRQRRCTFTFTLVIWQTLLSKATYNWGVHKAWCNEWLWLNKQSLKCMNIFSIMIFVFRVPYISSTARSLLQKIQIKLILLPFETWKGSIWADSFTIAVIVRAHFHWLIFAISTIFSTIVLNNFNINILITGCLFTTSNIKWQWNVYFTAYSNCSAVKPFKPALMIFFCFYAWGNFEWNITSSLCIKQCHLEEERISAHWVIRYLGI